MFSCRTVSSLSVDFKVAVSFAVAVGGDNGSWQPVSIMNPYGKGQWLV